MGFEEVYDLEWGKKLFFTKVFAGFRDVPKIGFSTGSYFW